MALKIKNASTIKLRFQIILFNICSSEKLETKINLRRENYSHK